MKRLLLYPAIDPSAAASGALPHDSACERCVLHEGARTVCMSAEGTAGGVYLLGERPGRVEDEVGRPFVGASGKMLREQVKKWWTGPVAFDSAVRCAPGVREVSDTQLDACRAYTARVLASVRPTRIVCLGADAMYSVLGRRAPIMSIRRGFGHVIDEDGIEIPVFFVMNPVVAIRNDFARQAFERDFKWALTCDAPAFPLRDCATWLVETTNDAMTAVHALEGRAFTYDIETYGRLYDLEFKALSVTLLAESDEHSYTWTKRALADRGARQLLARVLQSAPRSSSNGKFDDQGMMAELGIALLDPGDIDIDVRLVRKLNAADVAGNLQTMAELVGFGGHKQEAQTLTSDICSDLRRQAKNRESNKPFDFRLGKEKKKTAVPLPDEALDMVSAGVAPEALANEFLPEEILYRYNARDVFATRAVKQREAPAMSKHAERLWHDVSRPASLAATWMEKWGIAADRAAIDAFGAYCDQRVAEASARIKVYGDVNPRSAPQLREFLFNKLKLSSVKVTDSGEDSTDKEVLATLVGEHPVVEDILTFRKYDKLRGTYAYGMLPFIQADSRIHPSFLLDGAESGRMSCQDPPLQTLPRAKGSDDAKMARNCFVAAPGCVLVELDQSQIELRVAADLSQDKVMIADFVRGIDIHRNAAGLAHEAWKMTRAQWDALTKEEQEPFRSRMKSGIFAKLYGKGAKNLAKQLGVSLAVVQVMNDAIWGRYHALDAWTKRQIAETRKTGEVWTWWNGERAHCRPLWAIADQDDARRVHAENAAVNTPIQGTAALYTTASLWPIVDWILSEGFPAKLVLTVHDSIVLEVEESYVDEAIQFARQVMTSWPTQGVPLAVDAKVGYALGSMQEV